MILDEYLGIKEDFQNEIERRYKTVKELYQKNDKAMMDYTEYIEQVYKTSAKLDSFINPEDLINEVQRFEEERDAYKTNIFFSRGLNNCCYWYSYYAPIKDLDKNLLYSKLLYKRYRFKRDTTAFKLFEDGKIDFETYMEFSI